MVKVPVRARKLTRTVSVVVTDPFGDGVSEFGLKAHDTHAGRLAQESKTALLKPPVDVTAQLLFPELFRGCVSEAGVHVILKVGLAEGGVKVTVAVC